jgi:hypothetical protein
MKTKNILKSVRCVVISRARSAHKGGIYRVYGVNDIFFYKYIIRNAVWAVPKGNPPSSLTGILIELIHLHSNIV